MISHAAASDVFLDLNDSVVSADGLQPYLTVFQSRLPSSPGQRVSATVASTSLIVRDGRAFRPPRNVPALAHAVHLAQLEGRGLLIIRGAWQPNAQTLESMSKLVTLDPNIGMIQPRFSIGRSRDVLTLPIQADSTHALISPMVQSVLPEYFVTPELDAACLLITPQGVQACDAMANETGNSLAELLIGVRRRGLRNLVANRIVVDYPLPAATAYRVHEPTDSDSRSSTDIRAAQEWMGRARFIRLERLLSHATSGLQKRLLLDCRGMIPAHNGSAHAILGYLRGVSNAMPSEWEITACVGRDAAAFHDLTRRFPRLLYEYDRPRGGYLVALHLSQPWSVEMLSELHACAPLIGYNILDTIAWDAIYPAPAVLDDVTRLAARFADGLTYISEHSRQRFRFRFRPHERMHEAVTYLSMSPADYHFDGLPLPRQTIEILVVGNRLEHKDVARTTDKLAEAFPYSTIVAFGIVDGHQRHNVKTIASGQISDASIRDLLERASVIVYPSFSEGFGIPVVQGIALGKVVVAREMPLWHEINAHTGANGQLRTFRTDAELVDAVASALDHPPVLAHLKGSTIDWNRCASVLIDFAGELVEHFDFEHWMSRDLVFGPSSGGSSLARTERVDATQRDAR